MMLSRLQIIDARQLFAIDFNGCLAGDRPHPCYQLPWNQQLMTRGRSPNPVAPAAD